MISVDYDRTVGASWFAARRQEDNSFDLLEARLNLAASGRRALERFERQQRYNQ
jgi:hypothetical protein